MASSKQLAAWLLVGLATAGLLLPALIILVLRPQETRKVYEAVHATAPLDIYLVLDASGSVSDSDWRESLLFARDLSVQLNASVPQFRAGLGQFSSDFHDIFPVSEDVSPLAALPQGVEKKSGGTEMAKALCGNSFGRFTQQEEAEARCVGGAYGTLIAAPAQLPADLPPNCEELSSSRMIILVTDGRPGPDDKSKLASAFLKSATNVTVLGILVKHDAKAVEGEILYALSSCCPAESMKLTGTNDIHVTCELPMNESCHYMASMKDYAALRRSIDGIVQTLGDELQCEGVQELVSFLPDSRSLWFLLLLLPVLLHQIWQRSLLRISSSYKPKEAHGLPADVEMSTDVSRDFGLHVDMCCHRASLSLSCMEGAWPNADNQVLSDGRRRSHQMVRRQAARRGPRLPKQRRQSLVRAQRAKNGPQFARPTLSMEHAWTSTMADLLTPLPRRHPTQRDVATPSPVSMIFPKQPCRPFRVVPMLTRRAWRASSASFMRRVCLQR